VKGFLLVFVELRYGVVRIIDGTLVDVVGGAVIDVWRAPQLSAGQVQVQKHGIHYQFTTPS
jgi:hypothetical protein